MTEGLDDWACSTQGSGAAAITVADWNTMLERVWCDEEADEIDARRVSRAKGGGEAEVADIREVVTASAGTLL
jgi:hypothetical protein